MQESGVFHRAEVNESGYLGKIDLFTAGVALAEFPKPLVAVLGQCRVGRQHFGGRFPGDGQDLAVGMRSLICSSNFSISIFIWSL